MQMVTGNILDQLLGIADAKPNDKISGIANDLQSGMPDAVFGELFNSLLSGESNLDPKAIVTKNNSNLITGNMPDMTAEIDRDESKFLNQSLSLGVTDVDTDNDPVNLLPKNADFQNRINSISDNSTTQSENTKFNNLQQSPLFNNNSKSTLEIVQSEVKDGNLNLKVMGEGFNSEIEVSIPVSSLSVEKSSAANSNQLINSTQQVAGGLNQRPLLNQGQSISLENLLAQLDLKQIEITATESAEIQLSDESPMGLQLKGTKDGRPVILTGQVTTKLLNLTKVSKQGNSEGKAAGKLSPEALIESSDNIVGKSDKISGIISSNSSQSDLTGKNLTHRTSFTLIDKVTVDPAMSNGAKGNEFVSILDNNNLLKSSEIELPKEQRADQPVKLSIPDMNGRTINPSGQSIMIRIEPEHLGPARLNLTLKNNQLTAKVVVESMPAKLAIEGSLEQLTNQLSKAGVELDKIEITLSNGDSAHQFFDQRPNWNLAGRQGKSFNLHNEETEIEQVMPSRVSMPSAVQTSGSGGLNLLA